jgi:hypothetical protein
MPDRAREPMLTSLQQLTFHRHREVTLYGIAGGRWEAQMNVGSWPGDVHYATGDTAEDALVALWERVKRDLGGHRCLTAPASG